MTTADLFNDEIIRKHVEDTRFVERPWLVDTVESEAAANSCRFVIVTGESGAGKTVLTAALAAANRTWLHYFIRRDSREPLSSGDARSFLLAVGFQLAALRPELFDPEQLHVQVSQTIGTLSGNSRVVGLRVKQFRASPFRRAWIDVRQSVAAAEGEVVGAEIDQLIDDPRLIEPENLQYLALLGPALVLAKTAPDERITILVDAVDELRYGSGEGVSIVDWLAQCPELPSNIRIIITSRPNEVLLARFRAAKSKWIRELEISPEDERVREDGGRYLASRATSEVLAAAPTGYEVVPENFRRELLARWRGNFQYLAAYLHAVEQAGGALRQRDLTDPERHALDRMMRRLLDLSALPTGLYELYAFFIALIRDSIADSRFPVSGPDGGSAGWVPAWPGLYWPIISLLTIARAPLTTAQITELAGLACEPHWVADAVSRLRQFLARVDDRYSLFHPSVAEFLGEREAPTETRVDTRAWHRRLVAGALARHDGMTWRDVDEYLIFHLPFHAERAGELDRLVRLPGFLVVVDPQSLLRSLPAIVEPTARHWRRLYLGASHRMRTHDLGLRAIYLELSAWEQGSKDMAEHVATVDVPRPLRIRWADFHHVAYRRELTPRHIGPIFHIVPAYLGSRSVLVTGGDDGMIWISDLETGRPVGGAVPGHDYGVTALTVVHHPDRPYFVSAGQEGVVSFVDLLSGERFAGGRVRSDRISAIAVLQTDERRTLLCQGRDDPLLTVVNLVSGAITQLEPEDGDIGKLLSARVGDEQVVYAVGNKVSRVTFGSDGRLVFETVVADRPAGKVAIGAHVGEPTIVAVDARIKAWSLVDGRLLVDHPATFGSASDIAVTAGRSGALIALSSFDAQIWFVDLATGRSIGEAVPARTADVDLPHYEPEWVHCVTMAEIDGEEVCVSGDTAGRAKVWDLPADQPQGPPAVSMGRAQSPVSAVTHAVVGGEGLVVTSYFGSPEISLRRRDDGNLLRTLRAPWEVHDQFADIETLAACEVGEAAALFVGGHRGQIARIDLQDGTVEATWNINVERGSAQGTRTDGITALSALLHVSGPIVAVGDSDGGVSAWHADTCEALADRVKVHDSSVAGLAALSVDDHLMLVSGGFDDALSVTEPGHDLSISPLTGHGGGVGAVAVHRGPSDYLVLVGGWDGVARIYALNEVVLADDRWTIETLIIPMRGDIHVPGGNNYRIGQIVAHHAGVVEAVGFVEVGEMVAAVTGGRDGVLQVTSTVNRRQSLVIELGSDISALDVVSSGLICVGTLRGPIMLEISPTAFDRDS